MVSDKEKCRASVSFLFSSARRENSVLSQEYNKLQDSYKELEALKDELQGKESTWMSNLTDSQKKTESSKREVRLGDSYYFHEVYLGFVM